MICTCAGCYKSWGREKGEDGIKRFAEIAVPGSSGGALRDVGGALVVAQEICDECLGAIGQEHGVGHVPATVASGVIHAAAVMCNTNKRVVNLMMFKTNNRL